MNKDEYNRKRSAHKCKVKEIRADNCQWKRAQVRKEGRLLEEETVVSVCVHVCEHV